MKALIWVITALEDHKGDDTLLDESPEPSYSNLQRGPV